MKWILLFPCVQCQTLWKMWRWYGGFRLHIYVLCVLVECVHYKQCWLMLCWHTWMPYYNIILIICQPALAQLFMSDAWQVTTSSSNFEDSDLSSQSLNGIPNIRTQHWLLQDLNNNIDIFIHIYSYHLWFLLHYIKYKEIGVKWDTLEM